MLISVLMLILLFVVSVVVWSVLGLSVCVVASVCGGLVRRSFVGCCVCLVL